MLDGYPEKFNVRCNYPTDRPFNDRDRSRSNLKSGQPYSAPNVVTIRARLFASDFQDSKILEYKRVH